MQIIKKANELTEIINELKKEGKKIGLVPTMGALHRGHKSLIDAARKDCDIVVVSIFVNPIQFGENEDFDKYPRNFEKDKLVCKEAGCDIIFNPEPQEMYADYKKEASLKENLKIKEAFYTIKVPTKYTNKLCGKSRPDHFNGVCTIVLKLFNIIKPNVAYFGQKDIQQLIIIKNMVKSLNINTKIQGCPIVREESGLALSSRNSYLTESQKEKASTIFKVLSNIELMFNEGFTNKNEIFEQSKKLLHKDIEIEYLEVCDINTLDYSEKILHNSFVAIAAKIDNIRLIDNVVLS